MDAPLIILEGLHAVKHALRFKADIIRIVAVADGPWQSLISEYAPDILPRLNDVVEIVTPAEFKALTPANHHTGIMALARKPNYSLNVAQDTTRLFPAIYLEDPRHLGNIGAVIRVAAAARASSVMTSGTVDPWQPDAVRGSAGLHYAVPVVRITDLTEAAGPVIALDPTGTTINEAPIPPNAILAFGTERAGLSDETKRRADMIVSLPMRTGVSSLNLATSVAATLYYLKLISH